MIGYEVLEISVQEGQARVNTFVASGCNNSAGYMSGFLSWMRLAKSGSYTFSNTCNKFTALGCDTLALISGSLVDSDSNFASGCVSFCSDEQRVVNGTCSGVGCCQTSIPVGAKRLNISVGSSYKHSRVLGFNPCSYAFLIADDGFEFNKKDLAINGTYGYGAGLAQTNLSAYACKSEKSTRNNSTNGPRYRSNCSPGYEGNPDLEGGCIGKSDFFLWACLASELSLIPILQFLSTFMLAPFTLC